MKTLDSGQDKIQKICDKLRHETLEPAKEEANRILLTAKKRGEEIIMQAEKQAADILKQAKAQIEQERSVFHSSMEQASKQAVEALRQEIEDHLFNRELPTILDETLADPKVITHLIQGVTKALEKDGIETDIAAVIPKTVNKDQVIALLTDSLKKRLQEKPLEIGAFDGGIQIKLVGRRMIIDLTDQAIKELLANFVRKDLREIIFSQ